MNFFSPYFSFVCCISNVRQLPLDIFHFTFNIINEQQRTECNNFINFIFILFFLAVLERRTPQSTYFVDYSEKNQKNRNVGVLVKLRANQPNRKDPIHLALIYQFLFGPAHRHTDAPFCFNFIVSIVWLD